MRTADGITTLLPVALIILLLTNGVGALPQSMDFNNYPGDNWEIWKSGGSSSVSGGVLTIDSPEGYHEFKLSHPFNEWHQKVNNSKGWVIETRLKVNASTEPGCSGGGGLMIWINDHTNLIHIGFSTNEICIAYPNRFIFPMDTTDNFHAYRIESKLNQVKVYVDDVLRINQTLSTHGGGTDSLGFGDMGGLGKSLSYWDYFSYDVDLPSNMPPTVTITTPLSTTTSQNDWKYYREITIEERSEKTLNDYQILVKLNQSDFPEEAKLDGSDIRFEEDGKELSYWIEDYDPGAKNARIWVKIPSIPAIGEVKIRMYYGNDEAGSMNDGDKVFETFLDKNSLGRWINEGRGIPDEWNIVNDDLHFYSKKEYSSQEYDVNVPSQYVIETVAKAKSSYRFTGYDSLMPDNRIFDIWWHTYDSTEKYLWGFGSTQTRHISDIKASPDKYYNIKIMVDENSKKVNCFIYDYSSGLLITSFLNKNYAYGNPQHLNYVAIVDGFKCCDADIYTKHIFIRKYSTLEPTVSISAESLSQDSDGDARSDEKEKEMGINLYSGNSDSNGLKDPDNPNPTVPEKKAPGFGAIFAAIGLLAVAYGLRKRG